MANSDRAPAFTGLVVHRDPNLGYSLLLPDGWHRSELDDGSGAFYAPDPDDPLTGLEASARNLGTDVQPGDLPVLQRGFLAGLRQLQDCQIEQREAEAVGRLLTMEARLTFREGDAVRKRWTRLLYQGGVQVKIVVQGSTVERFEYWEPMFFTAMRTVRFGDWWSAALGVEWVETVFPEDADWPDGSPPPTSSQD